MATPKVSLSTIRNKKGITYRIDYYVNGKRIRQNVGPDKYNAELVRKRIEQKLLLDPYQIPTSKPKSISLGGLISEFALAKKHHVRKTTEKRYKAYFERFLTFFKQYFPAACADVRLMDPHYMNEFVNEALEPRRSDVRPWEKRTLNDCLRVAKSLFKYAIESGYVSANPLAGVKPLKGSAKKKVGFYSEEELTKIWKTIDSHWVDGLQFITNTGLRKAELINLRWESVNLTKGDEHIEVESYDDWETKTGKSRTIPLNAKAIEIIQRQKGKNDVYVFTSKEGKKIHPDKIYHALKTALQKLNIQGDVHKFRHNFAMALVSKNVDLNTIKEILGHSSLQITSIYLHPNAKSMREAVNRLSQ